MDSINENTDFVLSKVSSDEKCSQFKGNFTEELESERKVSPSKGTKALLILLGLTLVFALGGLCTFWMLYNNKHADFESLKEQNIMVSKQLAAQMINSTVMKREQDELRTNYTRVKEQLQLHDVLQKVMKREQDELRTNYTRVKEQLQLHEVMKREQDELRTNYTRVKEQLQLHDDLKRMQQYAVDVTLDPDTAHPTLILSDDGKQVRHGDIRQKLPDKPERFNYTVSVLGKEGFSSGKFYFEVQVKGKTEWSLGVARESINRKGQIILTPSRGFWTVWLRNENEYKALSDPSVSLSLSVKPQRVGVFVDYEEGLVSFYDVKSSSHIYSFTGQSFTGKLYPYFSPSLNNGGKNSAPLIITPV
ncbi:erythroid membrane-associated protein-like isoform X6 [Megalobrama amblycephala]|uniref:erythroid membrane-associated protein-like isoform X6 n=1 Tax=Megalobrama amblycephala TaxID=75352 RepID=UPI0020142117|nr:erythroid membrane-associated protein-like isoform X6 [Megalobrama amblycephala]